MPGTEKGYLENWAAEKSRLSSCTFPRAVEIGRRLLPIFPHLAFRETFPTWKHLFTEPPSMSNKWLACFFPSQVISHSSITWLVYIYRILISTPETVLCFVTAVSRLKPPCGGCRSETTTWIQKYFKKSVGTSKKL